MPPRLFLVTGCPGAGKTTLCHALLQRFPLGVRISVDDLRDQVVSGLQHPKQQWNDDIQLQFDTAREGAAAMAMVYLRKGFNVAIDDLLPHPAAELMLERIGHPSPTRIVLIPPVALAVERNRTRTNKTFGEAMMRELGEWIPGLHGDVIKNYGSQPLWRQLDSSRPIDELVEEAISASSPACDSR